MAIYTRTKPDLRLRWCVRAPHSARWVRAEATKRGLRAEGDDSYSPQTFHIAVAASLTRRAQMLESTAGRGRFARPVISREEGSPDQLIRLG